MPINYNVVMPFPHRLESGSISEEERARFNFGEEPKQPFLEFVSSPPPSDQRRSGTKSSRNRIKVLRLASERLHNTAKETSVRDDRNSAGLTRDTIQDEFIPAEIWNHVAAKHYVDSDQRSHMVCCIPTDCSSSLKWFRRHTMYETSARRSV